MRPRILRALIGLAVLCCSTGTSTGQLLRSGGLKAFVGARLFDGTGRGVVENAVLLIKDGRVVSAGPASRIRIPLDAERVDVAGRTIVPGFVNTHSHVGETLGLTASAENATNANVMSQLALYARYGVTTVVSLGGDHQAGFDVRDVQDTLGLNRARLYVAGPVLDPKTPDEARAQVREAAALGVNIVKIRVDDNLGTTPKMPVPVYQAVIDEAHRQKLRVAAHLFYLEDAKALVSSGADFVAHSVRDADVDDEFIRMLKVRGVCVCPTLTREVSAFVYESTPAFFSDPFFARDADANVLQQLRDPARQEAMRTSAAAMRYKAALDVAMRNLKRLSQAGVRIAFGTDTGPPGRFQGYFEHMEMELMARAGLTPTQILLSATGDGAACAKLEDRVGTLTPGRWGDFVVLDADPLENILNTRTINSVWIAGNRIERKAASATQP